MKVHVAVLWPPKTTAPIAVTYDDDPDAPAVLVEPRRFRVGRSLGRTVYAQVGEEPSHDDLLVGVMETPYMATVVVELLNQRFGPLRRGGWLPGKPDSVDPGDPGRHHQYVADVGTGDACCRHAPDDEIHQLEWRCPTAGCEATAVTYTESAPPRCFECPIPTGVVDGIQMVRA